MLGAGDVVPKFTYRGKTLYEHGNRSWPPITPENIKHEVENWMAYTRSVRKVSDRIFLCEHLMDYNLARMHEPTLNLSAHA